MYSQSQRKSKIKIKLDLAQTHIQTDYVCKNTLWLLLTFVDWRVSYFLLLHSWVHSHDTNHADWIYTQHKELLQDRKKIIVIISPYNKLSLASQ